ncbi:MAG: hypothetical protein ACQEQM_06245 [Thermoplasmatota archaeon]
MNSKENRNSNVSIISNSPETDSMGFGLRRFRNLEGITKLQIFIIIVLLVFMFLVGNPGQWIVGLIVLGIVGLNIFFNLYGKSEKLDKWERKNKLDNIIHLKISRTSDVAKSAFKGKKVSQAILEEKLIDEFIKKMMDKKNLNEAEIKILFDNPSKLKKVIGDEEISSFVLKGKSLKKLLQNLDEDASKKVLFRAIKEDKEYKRKIERLIKKMEEWN